MNIRLEKVSKSFNASERSIVVLHDVSVTFESGVSYAIVGSSGVGKSTLLHILAGLIKPSQGALYIDACNVSLLDHAQYECFLNTKIGLLFQAPYLIRELTVLENVMTKGLISGLHRDHCAQEAWELLSFMGLQDKASDKPPVLSGGQQQRVALARALFGRPSFLLADEPTGDLDPQTGQAIIELLAYCQQEWEMGIIVSTHDMQVAKSMHMSYELKDGTLSKKNA